MMLLDIEIRSCNRLCAATARPLEPGDVYFSVLEDQGAEVLRLDYSAQGWPGAPEKCLGWWRSRIPNKDESKPQLAPHDVMLNLFVALAEKTQEQEFRYLLGLLLLRRRILKTEDKTQDDQGRQQLVLYCPRRKEHYELLVADPDAERAAQVQERMLDLLYRDGDHTQS